MAGPDLEPLRQWLQQSTGLQAERLGRSSLERAVKRCWTQSGCSDPEAYVRSLPHDPRVQQQLIEQLVVGESWFLREPRSFEQLQQLARRERQRPLRVLSCGCAGGEEPYSVVIALLEAGLPLAQLQVEAIDISAVALARAAEGLYGRHALRGLERSRLERHFQPEECRSSRLGPASERWRLWPEIRAAVRFHHGDLQQQLNRLPGPWHAVLCRNVMLYLHDQARQDLLMAIAERLEPQGMLLVAAAEALLVSSDRYRSQPGGHGAAFTPISTAIPAGLGTPVQAPGSPARAGIRLESERLAGRAIRPQLADENRKPELSLQPGDHLALARCLQQSGKAEEALVAVRRCLYLDPARCEALELAAALARDLGRHQEAERLRRRLERQRRPRD